MTLGGGYMLPSREGHAIAAIGLGITMKTDGKSTHDAYSLFEYAIPPETNGPPPHVHTREDESFICLAGRLDVHLGRRGLRAGARRLPVPASRCRARVPQPVRRGVACHLRGLPGGVGAVLPGARGPARPAPRTSRSSKTIMADFGIELRLPPEAGLSHADRDHRRRVRRARHRQGADAGRARRHGVFDKAPDVGGVWSATRRYPGLTHAEPEGAVLAVGLPDARHYPEWPTGAQVQAYLADVRRQVRRRPRTAARHRGDSCPTGRYRRPMDGRQARHAAAAEPRGRSTAWWSRTACSASPPCPPTRDWRSSPPPVGGSAPAPSSTTLEEARDKHVLVVGYGKSACDVTVPISEVAASTDVIARAAALEGAPEDRRRPQLQVAAADPDGRGACSATSGCGGSRTSCTAPATASAAGCSTALGTVVGAAVAAEGARPGAARPHGGHRPRRHRAWPPTASTRAWPPGRIMVHRDRHDRAAAGAGRPAARRAERRHLAPADLVVCAHRLPPGRAVPRRARSCAGSPTSAATSCSTGRSGRSTCRRCTSTATTRRSSAR